MTPPPASLLTPAQACKQFGCCRNTLAAWRERGIVKAQNLNPTGLRAVWRYHNSLEIQEDIDREMKYLDAIERFRL